MDIKESIEKAVATIAQDKALQEQFKTDPVEAVQKLLGVELPVDVLYPGPARPLKYTRWLQRPVPPPGPSFFCPLR